MLLDLGCAAYSAYSAYTDRPSKTFNAQAFINGDKGSRIQEMKKIDHALKKEAANFGWQIVAAGVAYIAFLVIATIYPEIQSLTGEEYGLLTNIVATPVVGMAGLSALGLMSFLIASRFLITGAFVHLIIKGGDLLILKSHYQFINDNSVSVVASQAEREKSSSVS